MRYTVKDFHHEFPNDDVCLATIFTKRYGDVDTCPSCKLPTRFYRVKKRKCYACMHCAYQLHPLADTIFHKSRTPLTSWFYVIYLFGISNNGVAATEVQRLLGVTYKTAHRMTLKVRSLMSEGSSPIGGEGKIVEADEMYYGAKVKGRAGMYNKAPVLGIIERGGGEVRAIVSDTASTRRVKRFFGTYLVEGSELHTDESRIYKWTDKEMVHKSVNHSKYEFAKDGVTTNTIERFWSQLRRSLDGTHHAVSKRYLHLYVSEFVFHYNHRGVAVYPVLLERASRPYLVVC